MIFRMQHYITSTICLSQNIYSLLQIDKHKTKIKKLEVKLILKLSVLFIEFFQDEILHLEMLGYVHFIVVYGYIHLV